MYSYSVPVYVIFRNGLFNSEYPFFPLCRELPRWRGLFSFHLSDFSGLSRGAGGALNSAAWYHDAFTPFT